MPLPLYIKPGQKCSGGSCNVWKSKVLPKVNLRFSKLYLPSVYSFGMMCYTEYNEI